MFGIEASNAIGGEYDVRGLVISGCFSHRNGTAAGQPSLLRATSKDYRPIDVTLIGCVESNSKNDLSILALGNVKYYKAQRTVPRRHSSLAGRHGQVTAG